MQLAEISLLGGLGCGSWLLRLVLEEFEVAGLYEYVIVQATDNSVPFYETFGFIRVGAVAKYREKTREQLEAMAVATKKNPPGKSKRKHPSASTLFLSPILCFPSTGAHLAGRWQKPPKLKAAYTSSSRPHTSYTSPSASSLAQPRPLLDFNPFILPL